MTEAVWQPTKKQSIALSCPVYELMYGGAKGGGKDMTLCVPVPTPDGWSTVGNLAVGGRVFAASGEVATVIYKSEIFKRRCYELEFSDGTKISCSGEHPWSVYDFAGRRALQRRSEAFRSKRRDNRKKRGTGKRPDNAARNSAKPQVYLPPPEPRVVSTADIAASIDVKLSKGTAKNFSIENQGALELPTRNDLPVVPYTFGAWLGDGVTGTGQICLPEIAGGGKAEVVDGIVADGYACSRLLSNADVVSVVGLGALTRVACPRGKMIPLAYLRSSREQRLALLHGLMDTDGWAEKDGSCRISLSKEDLFLSVVELLRTLGINPHVTSKIPTYPYKGERRFGKRAFTATFMAPFPVFRLPRKLALQKTTVQSRYMRRFIVAAREVESVETQCIGIDHPSHLFIAGEQFIPTHNTDFLCVDFLPQLKVATEHWKKTGIKSRGTALLIRKEFPRLKDIIRKCGTLFPKIDKDVSWKAQDHAYVFSSGYQFEFGHLEGPNDEQNYQGREFTWLGFDQVEEIPKYQYDYLKLQVRGSEDHMKPLWRVRSTANPMGRHADWVKERFVTPCRDGFKIITEKTETSQGIVMRDRVFIPATLRDNPHLPPEYEAELLSAPEHYRRAFLDGDWDVVPGSFFGDVFDPRVHVCDPFTLPKHWEVFRAADWGSRAPACCLWIAIDNDGNLIVVEELYCPGQTGQIFGKKLLEIEEAWGWTDSKGYSKLHGWMDHQGRQNYGSEGPTPTEAMIEMGISWFDADKERKAGWTEVRRRLMERGGAAGRTPGLRIFRNCRNLIRTLPNLVAKAEDPDDIDSKQEDHAADALRYGAMSRPMSRVVDKEQQEIDQWESIMRLRKAGSGANERNPVTGY